MDAHAHDSERADRRGGRTAQPAPARTGRRVARQLLQVRVARTLTLLTLTLTLTLALTLTLTATRTLTPPEP